MIGRLFEAGCDAALVSNTDGVRFVDGDGAVGQAHRRLLGIAVPCRPVSAVLLQVVVADPARLPGHRLHPGAVNSMVWSDMTPCRPVGFVPLHHAVLIRPFERRRRERPCRIAELIHSGAEDAAHKVRNLRCLGTTYCVGWAPTSLRTAMAGRLG